MLLPKASSSGIAGDRASTPAIIVAPYQFLQRVTSTEEVSHAVSILGDSDRLEWPNFPGVETLRLRFDDIHAPVRGWVPPSHEHVAKLIEFGRRWAGSGSIVIHCRAASSRSPAAAMIVAAVLAGPDSDDLVRRVAAAKSYHRPHNGMLALADRILKRRSSLVELAQPQSRSGSTDTWGPAWIPLTARKAGRSSSAGVDRLDAPDRS
jgi:predicted protein tyrosine phosphatase